MPKTKKTISRNRKWYRKLEKEKLSEYLTMESQDSTNQAHLRGYVTNSAIRTNQKTNETSSQDSIHSVVNPLNPTSASSSYTKGVNNSNRISSSDSDSSKDYFMVTNEDMPSEFISDDNEVTSDEKELSEISCVSSDVPQCNSSPTNNIPQVYRSSVECQGPPSSLDKLRTWAINYKIPHNALNNLLGILSNATNDCLRQLPRDARTFLLTPRNVVTRTVDPGTFYYFGLQNSIQNQYLINQLAPSDKLIEIAINIDGLPLSRSTSSQFYPILGINKSLDIKAPVFTIGIYHGNAKPTCFNDLLSEFVEEASELTNSGINIMGKKVNFKVSMFLMDAVAKAYVLNIKAHSGYFSCTKCTQKGTYLDDRVCFPDLQFVKRTHEDFVLRNNSDHHVGETPILASIPGVNLIEDVPLDYMHLVLLGVVKKIISGVWISGRPPCKLSSRQISSISENLVSLKHYLPSEFARKPRTLNEVKRWKATEFRQFLYYTGPVVLLNIVNKKNMNIF